MMILNSTKFLRWFSSLMQGLAVMAGVCLTVPAVRILEPEFTHAPNRVTYRHGDKARLFCSVRHLGERTVVWRKMTQKNPLTIGRATWVDDPRIFVDHDPYSNRWDLVIEDVNPRDAGKYECQISVSKKLLRHIVKLHITGKDHHNEQVKRNPDIIITGTQFVQNGASLSLFCNSTLLGNPFRTLVWMKNSENLEHDARITLKEIHHSDRESLSSHLQIVNARTDDSGLYTCKSRDRKVMTSAHVTVLTAGSNNVKRAGSSSQERGAVLSVHYPNMHSIFILLLLLLQALLT